MNATATNGADGGANATITGALDIALAEPAPRRPWRHRARRSGERALRSVLNQGLSALDTE